MSDTTRPTKTADFAKCGDRVKTIRGTMIGTVLRIVKLQSGPYAVVQWPSSKGRHSLTTLQKLR